MRDKSKQDSVERLIAKLKHTDYYVRCDAAYALGESKDARAIKPLLRLLGDTTIPQERPVLETEVKSRAAVALAKIGEKAVPALINALTQFQIDPKGKRRYWIINALGLTKDQRAVKPLIHALNGPNRSIREGAIEALGRIQDPEALKPLIHVFQNLHPKDGYLFFATATALGSIGGGPALQVLEEALAHLNPLDGAAYDSVHDAIQKILSKGNSSE